MIATIVVPASPGAKRLEVPVDLPTLPRADDRVMVHDRDGGLVLAGIVDYVLFSLYKTNLERVNIWDIEIVCK